MLSPVEDALRKLRDGCRGLGRAEATLAFESLLGPSMPDEATAGAFLTALHVRGETEHELLAVIDSVRRRQRLVTRAATGLDIGGTGGDGGQTINVSTLAALVVSACGVEVFKHGNRAVSGRCGSIDLVERLGLPLAITDDAVRDAIARHRMAFLPSSSFLAYPAALVALRRRLGIRTAFNLAGPWCHPARVRRQVVGTSRAEEVAPFCRVAVALGLERALVVHGRREAIDECSPSGPTLVGEVRNGRVKLHEILPDHLGLRTTPLGPPPAAVDESAERARAVLAGCGGVRADRVMVLMTSGMALYLAGRARTMRDGVGRAIEAIVSGAALRQLEALQAAKKGAVTGADGGLVAG